MAKLLKIPGTLQTRAALQPSTFNEEAGTVEVVWTTGSRGLRSAYGERYFEELEVTDRAVDMSRLNNRAPVLANHSRNSLNDVVGVIERAWIQNGQGRALVRLSERDEVKGIRADIKAGILSHISVGYSIERMEMVEKVEDVPVYRATRWQPQEISFVPVGFDDKAVVRSETQDPREIEITISGEPLTERNTMDPEEIKRLAAERAAELKAASDAAVKAERERVAAIGVAVRSAKLGEDFASKLVADGTSADQARALVLEKLAARTESTEITTAHSVQITDDESDKRRRGITAWMIEKSGSNAIAEAKRKGVKGFEKVELDGAEFRGMTLTDIVRDSLTRAGVKTSGIYDRQRLVDMAMSRAGYASTSDFPVLFENIMHKQLRAQYALQADSWRRFCKTDTVSDFRASNRYLQGSFGSLDLLAEGGEYQSRAIPDGAKTSISVETYGGKISISRQAIINDDMGALMDIASRFGRSAGLSIEKAVYALLQQNSGLGPVLSDSNTFFHASRGNIGTGAALSVAALDADKVLMRKQKDLSSNEYLDLSPSILVLPVGLESAAKVINTSAFDHTNTNNGKPNPVFGMFSDIVSSPRLDGSATRRYLFTAQKEAFSVVFLEGAGEGPVMDSQADFNTDGMSWKARIDFKVNPFDPKHAITNAGA